MPAAYSYDLRQKVINAIDDGMSKTQKEMAEEWSQSVSDRTNLIIS